MRTVRGIAAVATYLKEIMSVLASENGLHVGASDSGQKPPRASLGGKTSFLKYSIFSFSSNCEKFYMSWMCQVRQVQERLCRGRQKRTIRELAVQLSLEAGRF
jgi:hypothetical protein